MLDAIKHIKDDNFFFQEDSAQVHCVCNTVQFSEKCLCIGYMRSIAIQRTALYYHQACYEFRTVVVVVVVDDGP